jgi:nucleotide-binding universal stress UspA family protein
MSTALVAIDNSGPALRALRHAMTVCDGIRIINVQQRADAPVLLLHRTQDEIDRVQAENGRRQLDDARKVLVEAGRAFTEHVVVGEPAATIVNVARAERVDLIVMGTRGMGAFGNLVLGSTANKVIHLAEVPVTVVK